MLMVTKAAMLASPLARTNIPGGSSGLMLAFIDIYVVHLRDVRFGVRKSLFYLPRKHCRFKAVKTKLLPNCLFWRTSHFYYKGLLETIFCIFKLNSTNAALIKCKLYMGVFNALKIVVYPRNKFN